MFGKFFEKKNAVPKNEALVEQEVFKKPVDDNWNTFLLPDVLVLSAHEANKSKNKLAQIANLFPEQYKDLKSKAESGEVSEQEIAETLQSLAGQIPE